MVLSPPPPPPSGPAAAAFHPEAARPPCAAVVRRRARCHVAQLVHAPHASFQVLVHRVLTVVANMFDFSAGEIPTLRGSRGAANEPLRSAVSGAAVRARRCHGNGLSGGSRLGGIRRRPYVEPPTLISGTAEPPSSRARVRRRRKSAWPAVVSAVPPVVGTSRERKGSTHALTVTTLLLVGCVSSATERQRLRHRPASTRPIRVCVTPEQAKSAWSDEGPQESMASVG